MTKTQLTTFTGTIGTNPTLATEAWAAAVGGTTANMTYQAGIAGTSGQSIQVTGARHFQWNPATTHWRLGMWVNRVSGTQTAGQAIALLRSVAVARGDLFLRNQNGGQLALRSGASGTTYAGQSTLTIANGDVWWAEVEVNGTALNLHLWEPGNTSGIPDDTFTSTMTGTVDNVLLFNPTGSTGLTMKFGELWWSDGEQIRAGAVSAGTLTFLSNVWADQSEVVIVGKVADAAEVTVTVGGGSVTVTPDSAGYFRAVVGGLTAGTAHAWDVAVDGASRRTGSVTTLPSAANGMSFLWGSCFDSNTSGAFALMNARNPAFVAQLGDWGYQYITGGPNGNTSPTDIATVRAHRESVLAAPLPQGFFSKYPTAYTMSDCDGGGANSDSTTGGLANGVVQSAYRQQFAHPTLPLVNSGGRSWVVGRVRFILTDETVAASNKADADTSTKTKLGAEQKAWFKGQIDAAVAAGQAVVWFGDGPWITPTALTGNEWRAYNTERTELGNYIAASGVRLVRLHGDTHTLFADDGTNNPWGGFPTASAAPMHTQANPYGTTVSGGKWPTTQTVSSRQYGVGTVADDGTTLTLTIKGYSSTNSAPTEVERFNETFNLTPASTVDRTASGVLTLAGTATRTISVSRNASGTLALTGSASREVSLARSAAGVLTLEGTATPVVTVARTASGTLTLTGTAERAITVTRTAVGSLELTGAASTTGSTDRTAQGSLAIQGSATATVTIARTATGTLTLTGQATPAVQVARTAQGTLALGGIGTVTFHIVRTAMGVINLTGVGATGGRAIPDVLTLTETPVSHTLTPVTVTHTLEDQ